MRLLIISLLLLWCPLVSANGVARIDKSTGRILTLSEPAFTTPPTADQQDVALPTDATSFAKTQLGGEPTQWKLDPLTKAVSHDFIPLPDPKIAEHQATLDAMATKLGLSKKEMADLKEALR